MSSFSVPPLISGINFDTSHFHAGMDSVAEHAKHGGEAIGHGIEHGLMSAEAAMHLFPPLAIELIENPILGAVAAAMEGLKKLAELVGEVLDHFQQVNLGSIKSGLDPETFSTFAAAAKSAGVEVATFTSGIELLQDRAANALRGDEGAAKGFTDLGISAKELAGLLDNPKELLLRVADAMQAIDTPGKRVQAAMESMGRGGKEMLPFLELGSAGIRDMAGKLGDLGARVDDEEAAQGKAWGKLSAEFSAAWEGIKTEIAKPILEFFQDELNDTEGGVGKLAERIKQSLHEAFAVLGPIVHGAWEALKGFADFAQSVLVPVLDVVQPILEAVGKALQLIADVAGGALHALASVLHGVVGDLEGAGKSWDLAEGSRHHFLQDVGFESKPEIHVKADVHVGTAHESHKIVGEINKSIAEGYREYNKQMRSQLSGEKVKRAMRGGR